MTPPKPEWLSTVRAALGAFAEISDGEWENASRTSGIVTCGKTSTSSGRELSGHDGVHRVRNIPVFTVTESGEERTLAFRDEGRMLSAFSAFLEHTPSWYNIQALEESDLLCITLEQYAAGLQGDTCWRLINARYTQMLFVEKERRESELLSDDAPTRYGKFQARFRGRKKGSASMHVASYLGITPVALGRIRKKLRDKRRI